MDVHVDVLGGFDDPVDVALFGASLVRQVLEIERPLVEEDRVEVLDVFQVVPVVRGQAAGIRTQVLEKRLPARGRCRSSSSRKLGSHIKMVFSSELGVVVVPVSAHQELVVVTKVVDQHVQHVSGLRTTVKAEEKQKAADPQNGPAELGPGQLLDRAIEDDGRFCDKSETSRHRFS